MCHDLTKDETATPTSPIKYAPRVVIAALAFSIVSAPIAAFATNGITTTGDVNLRQGPGTGFAILDVVPAGTSPEYLCYTQAENVNGVDVWFEVAFEGQTGYISSYYDDSSYYSDSDIPSKYGIPACGQPAAAPSYGPVTGGQTDTFDRAAAAQWAYDNATRPQDFDAGCTWFVSQALWAGGMTETPDWNDDGTHGNWRWSTRPGTASATAVVPFIAAFLDRFPYSYTEQLDLAVNPVPDAEVGDLIAYDWENDGNWDHLSIVTSIADGKYPNVAEWGTADFPGHEITWGHASIDYHERGWTWSQNSDSWLQAHYPEVTAMLIHIDPTLATTY